MEGEPGDITVTSANRKCAALTGSARKIKDNAADWHNLLLRWEKFNQDGFTTATAIINIKRSQNKQLEESRSPPPPPAGGAEELQDQCCKLQNIIHKMVAMVTKMDHLMTSQRGIQELEEFQFGPEGRTLFNTWDTENFTSSCGELREALSQELRLKQTLLQEVAHCSDPDLDLVLLSCWIHQPYTAPQVRRTLEALLLETGHRPL